MPPAASLHADGQTVVKERIYLDKTNKDLLRNEITTIDNALTRPWTVTKTYRRDLNAKVIWFEYVCAEGNHHIVVGKENYFVSGDGYRCRPARTRRTRPEVFRSAKVVRTAAARLRSVVFRVFWFRRERDAKVSLITPNDPQERVLSSGSQRARTTAECMRRCAAEGARPRPTGCG
jgi:hypothetical protein